MQDFIRTYVKRKQVTAVLFVIPHAICAVELAQVWRVKGRSQNEVGLYRAFPMRTGEVGTLFPLTTVRLTTNLVDGHRSFAEDEGGMYRSYVEDDPRSLQLHQQCERMPMGNVCLSVPERKPRTGSTNCT